MSDALVVAQPGLSFGETGLHEDAVVDEKAADDVTRRGRLLTPGLRGCDGSLKLTKPEPPPARMFPPKLVVSSSRNASLYKDPVVDHETANDVPGPSPRAIVAIL